MLHELPSQNLQTNHHSIELLLLIVRDVAVDLWVATGSGQSRRLFKQLLLRTNTVIEAVLDVQHILVVIHKLQVGQQVLQNICLIIEYVDVLKHEIEEGRVYPARHRLAMESVHVLELQISQETLLLHTLGLDR